MEDLNIQVVNAFGINVKKVVKQKNSYICKTENDIKVIKKTLCKIENIVFQHEIKEHLYNLGFQNIDRFYLSTIGNPYVIFADNIYVMTDLFNFRESDYSNLNDLYAITNSLAIMHKKAVDINFKGTIFYQKNVLSECEEKAVELHNVKKFISNKKRLSDFDVMFIKNYEFYKEKIDFCIQKLNQTKYNDLICEARKRNFISHNLIKEENILLGINSVHIIDFSNARVDYPIIDICSLIQRHIKNLPVNHSSIYNILDVYNKNNSITKQDIEILYILLKYPIRFLKICSQYYSKKRKWVPNSIINRMESVIATKDVYESYIDELSNIFK